jgi:predicted acylesterase/phospholipase RssA
VSAGSFIAAALANGIGIGEIHASFIEERPGVRGGERRACSCARPSANIARRASALPAAARALRLAIRRARPFPGRRHRVARRRSGRAVPTGIFDNRAIAEYISGVFRGPGRTDDFRALRRRLYLVATDLDTGESVSFGRPGRDHVPISKAVQASSALPGLFPPVEIDGHWFVDGALRKTLHASEALDDGMRLVICVNPIVPFDARGARQPRRRLVEGGLPVVLSQTFRAIIHSRLAVGLSKYRSQYRGADVLLFEPAGDDSEVFSAHLFGYASRRRICEHAYQRTRRDLGSGLRAGAGPRAPRAEAAPPLFSRRLPPRALPRWRLPEAANNLRASLDELEKWLRTGRRPRAADGPRRAARRERAAHAAHRRAHPRPRACGSSTSAARPM